MPKKKTLLTLLKITVSIGIFSILIARMDMNVFQAALNHIQPRFWLYSAIFIFMQQCLLSYRWQILMNIGRRSFSFLQSLRVTLASLVANMLFFTSISGIFMRIALALGQNVPVFKSVFVTLIDRLMTLCALVFLSALVLPAFSAHTHNDFYESIALSLCIFVTILFIFLPLFTIPILKAFPKFPFIKTNRRFTLRYVRILLGQPKTFFPVICTSLIAQCCFFLSVYMITIESHSPDLSLYNVMSVMPFISLVASFPISFGGWGVREGAFVFGLGLLGVAHEDAFLMSVQIGLLGIITTTIIGLPALASLNIEEMKQNITPLLTHKDTNKP